MNTTKFAFIISVIVSIIKRPIVIEKEDVAKFIMGKHVKYDNLKSLAALAFLNEKVSKKRVQRL